MRRLASGSDYLAVRLGLKLKEVFRILIYIPAILCNIIPIKLILIESPWLLTSCKFKNSAMDGGYPGIGTK